MGTSTDSKDFLDDLREKYIKVRKLLDSREDETVAGSESTLKRKNEAVDILKEMQIKLEDALNDESKRDDQLTVMLAIVWLDIGIVSIDNEELKAGEENLMRCGDALSGKEATPQGVLPALSALNQLGIVWFQWTEPTKAESFLNQAEEIYKKYKSSEKPKPVAMASIFGVEDDKEPSPDEVLDKLHTLTLYYLAQIYGVTKDHHKSAVYCHMTLQRQLDHSDLDHIDWALNAATMSQFFMEKGGFTQARHHLSAASYILKIYEDTLGEPPKEEDKDEVAASKWERFRHRSADVARCWAKYGILLMSTSRERLIALSENSESEKHTESANNADSELTAEKNEFFEKMKFSSIEKDIESIANQVTDKHLLDFNDARAVFLNVQKWLDEAKKYYNFESHASDYVQIVSDISLAFKYLAFFEDNEERQAKMHKRRIDILESVVNELNPRYYQTECRQIWIELAETYSAILNIKLDKLRANDEERPTPHALGKINNCAQSSIKYYQTFLDSLKETENSPAVTKFSDEMVRPAMFAFFHLGTLYNKIITPDKHAQLDNVKKSIEAYKFFVDYCESNEELAEFMKAELNVCKDLVNLLPLKMNKLIQAISAK